MEDTDRLPLCSLEECDDQTGQGVFPRCRHRRAAGHWQLGSKTSPTSQALADHQPTNNNHGRLRIATLQRVETIPPLIK